MEIILDDVSKVINQHKIIDHISLKIKEGTVFGLIGPNGAGKTTLIRLMLNIYTPSEGNIHINKINTRSDEFQKIKPNIGVLLDSLGLYKAMTAWQNVEFYDRIYYKKSTKRERYDRIRHSLELVDLMDHADENINFFSRGMRQRLALARTFNSKPKLLILDEPSRGLDMEGQFAVRHFIESIKKEGTTVFINSHNLGELQKVCERFAFISKGRIMENGSFGELREKYEQQCQEEFSLEYVYKIVNGIKDK